MPAEVQALLNARQIGIEGGSGGMLANQFGAESAGEESDAILRTHTGPKGLDTIVQAGLDGDGPDLGLHLGMAGRIVIGGPTGEHSAGDPKPTAAGRGS